MNKTLDLLISIEDIQKVIGTPEENQEILVKAILMEKRLLCTVCDKTYLNKEDMDELQVNAHTEYVDPRKLTVTFKCRCGHPGEIILAPNPFIPPPFKG